MRLQLSSLILVLASCASGSPLPSPQGKTTEISKVHFQFPEEVPDGSDASPDPDDASCYSENDIGVCLDE